MVLFRGVELRKKKTCDEFNLRGANRKNKTLCNGVQLKIDPCKNGLMNWREIEREVEERERGRKIAWCRVGDERLMMIKTVRGGVNF